MKILLLGIAVGILLTYFGIRVYKSKRIIHVLENGMRVKRRVAMESFALDGETVKVEKRYFSILGVRLFKSKKMTVEELLRTIPDETN